MLVFGLICCDTSRSRAYLSAMIGANLLPSWVIYMKPEESDGQIMPGQLKSSDVLSEPDSNFPELQFDTDISIEQWLKATNIPFITVVTKDINSEYMLDALQSSDIELFVYSGFGGGILRMPMLSLGKKFLHVHGGFLPEYKGSTANYFSILNEGTIGASSILLSEDIDAGPILYREKFPAPSYKKDLDHFYDTAVRARVLVKTLKILQQTKEYPLLEVDNAGGTLYYIIHPVLKHLAVMSQRSLGSVLGE